MTRITPDMPREVAARICIEESGDLKARWMLVDLAEAALNDGTKQRRRAYASLIHAYEYLTDRDGYELAPWPKNMVKLPASPCRHRRAPAPAPAKEEGR